MEKTKHIELIKPHRHAGRCARRSYWLGESIHRRRLGGACREGLDGRDVAPGAPTPVDRSRLEMMANQFPLIGGTLLPAGFA